MLGSVQMLKNLFYRFRGIKQTILIVLMSFIGVYAQDNNFLPMQIGNEYQYVSNNYGYFYWEMDRDTIYPNGNRYYTFPGWLEIGDCRIDSNGNLLSISKPFFIDGDPEEYLLFKADAEINEVWSIAWNYNSLIDTGYGRCIFDDTLYVFGEHTRVKGTLIFDESYYYFFFWLAEGIGIIRSQYDDGSTLDINYAKINGKIYGELVSVEEENKPSPAEFSLSQNYPNPFNSTTRITYSIKEGGFVSLKIYDILGNEIAKLVNVVQSPGAYSAVFNASECPSGIYIYTIEVNDFISTKKMLLLK